MHPTAEGVEAAAVLERGNMDLKKLTRSDKHLDEKCVKTMCAELCGGVNFLHRHGVMHRDLKLSNILINAEYNFKICDFGLSRGFGEVE